MCVRNFWPSRNSMKTFGTEANDWQPDIDTRLFGPFYGDQADYLPLFTNLRGITLDVYKTHSRMLTTLNRDINMNPVQCQEKKYVFQRENEKGILSIPHLIWTSTVAERGKTLAYVSSQARQMAN